MRASAKSAPSAVRVSGPASTTCAASGRASTISSTRARAGVGIDRHPLPGDSPEHDLGAELLAEPGARERADDVAAAADAEHERLARLPQRAARARVPASGGRLGCEAAARLGRCAGGSMPASRAIASIPAAARSNSSSAITGVPSNGSSRSISTHDRQPAYSGRTFTVTGRGMR